jgi:S1-C subfamily serine protease
MKYLLTFLLVFVCSFAFADQIDDKLEQILYPIVRVTDSKNRSGGSGVIVYSEDREKSGEYQTFISTNHHVIASSIHVEKVWNNLTKSYSYVENNDLVNVEIFTYANGGRTVTRSPVKADIVSYVADEDIALLKLRYPFEVKHKVSILPPGKQLRLFQEVYCCGCPLLSDPVFTRGEVTDLEVIIDKRIYIQSSADIIWGNSGGGAFAKLGKEYYFVGIPSRVSVSQYQAVTYLGYFISPVRIQKFVRSQKLDFLLDKSVTPTESFKNRETLKRKVIEH